MNNKKGFVSSIIVIIIIIITIGSGTYFYINKKIISPIKISPIACTMDAKMCPDGSYVGRTGPKCEFICPEVKITENNLINNFCKENTDCKYIWYTGGCNTPEYVTQKQKEAKEKGLNISEAQPRENVTCTCENNKCITNN